MARDHDVAGVERLSSETFPPEEGSFLVLERMRCRTLYGDGTASEPYLLACLHRRGVDSVAVTLYDDSGPELRVGIRRALRPILYFRPAMELPVPDGRDYPEVWEAVAGSLEPEDRGEEGLRRRVVEEVWEEAGFRIGPEQVEDLGAGFFPSHGQSSEKIHLCAVRVRQTDQVPGQGRGTGPSEEGRTHFLEAGEILRMCREGEIEDPKVEIGVRRLLER
jgi:ADP-ribose pyrophosphatase